MMLARLLIGVGSGERLLRPIFNHIARWVSRLRAKQPGELSAAVLAQGFIAHLRSYTHSPRNTLSKQRRSYDPSAS